MNSEKTTVIHHSADYDGIFCREIARKFLPEAELIGWDFGDNPLAIPQGMVYVLDLPLDKPFGLAAGLTTEGAGSLKSFCQEQPIIWIDHHKSAIETHPKEIPGYRIDGVAACRLAWQWFTHDYSEFGIQHKGYPMKGEFINRLVNEPLAVRLAGEYDIWDHRGDGDLEFQFGLRAEDGALAWDMLLSQNMGYTDHIVRNGKVVMRYSANVEADLVKYRSYRMEWEGLNWIVLNTGKFNSLTFAALDVPETGHDGLLGYMFNGKKWTVSLYHAKHKTDLDLSAIATKHGGGGHRGACGFVCDRLPFA